MKIPDVLNADMRGLVRLDWKERKFWQPGHNLVNKKKEHLVTHTGPFILAEIAFPAWFFF